MIRTIITILSIFTFLNCKPHDFRGRVPITSILHLEIYRLYAEFSLGDSYSDRYKKPVKFWVVLDPTCWHLSTTTSSNHNSSGLKYQINFHTEKIMPHFYDKIPDSSLPLINVKLTHVQHSPGGVMFALLKYDITPAFFPYMRIVDIKAWKMQFSKWYGQEKKYALDDDEMHVLHPIESYQKI